MKYKLFKTGFRVVVAMVLASTICGCQKYLDQTPNDSLTRAAFFKTEADANASIVGVYDGLQGCVGSFLTWGEFRGDLITPVSNSANTYSYYEFFSPDQTAANSVASDWTAVYRMIGRANIVIESVPGIVQIDRNFTQAKSDAIVGEARFLRALGYFYLVRTFKEAPLVLTASSSDDVNYKVPKSPSDSILNQIEKDLTLAEPSVPVQYTDNVSTRGRATRAAVNALQTDVYLWRAKYQQAADASKKVLDNITNYSLVPGINWFSIFSQKNTVESILEVQFNYQLSETNSLAGLSNSFNTNTSLISLFNIEGQASRGQNFTYISNPTPAFWKYNGLAVQGSTFVSRSTNDANFILYRLADVMLMRAEALAHLGFNEHQEAINLINKIRERAGVTQYSGIDGSVTTATLQTMILKERAMELAMEGKRWFDLVRVATNENSSDILINAVLAGRLVTERALIRSRIIDPRSWYLPISSTELNRNSALIQNPYYQ